MYSDSEFAAALEQANVELTARMVGKQPSIPEIGELREYAKSHTDLGSPDLTAEQAAWKVLYDGLTESLRKSAPELMARIEALEAMEEAAEAKMKAHPHDYGLRVPLGFLIVGALLGFIRSPSLLSVLIFGGASWVAGLCFSIFVMNSANVQMRMGFRLEGTVFQKLGRWFVRRALTIR